MDKFMPNTPQCYLTLLLLIFGAQAFSKDVNSSNSAVAEATDYPLEIKIENHKADVEQPTALAVDIHGIISNGERQPYYTYSHGLDGLSLALVGANDETNERPYALTWNADKSIAYALSREDRKRLISIDPTNGNSTKLSKLTGYPQDQLIQGMAIDQNNTCYVVATDNENHDTVSYLYQCNLMTGALTLIGSQTLAPDIHDIAATCDGKLYGANTASSELIEIDRDTGQATLVGSMQFANDDYYVVTLTYDRQNGILYPYVLAGTGYHTALAQMSKTTGKVTFISDTFTFGHFVGGIQSSCADQVESFKINAGFNGSYFNPETAGQGLMVDVFADADLFFVAWFTFDESGDNNRANIGSDEQRWFTASGPLGEDSTVELKVYSSSGGVFNDPAEVATTEVGTMTLTFEDCVGGTAEYNLTDTNSSGSFPFQRIAGDNIDLCESLLNAE